MLPQDHRVGGGVLWLGLAVAGLLLCGGPRPAAADGKLVPPADYQGSLEEVAQEAVIIFLGSEQPGGAVEDLILKLSVRGAADHFAWVVPLPNEPQTAKEDGQLFRELFDYVEARMVRPSYGSEAKSESPAAKPAGPEVEVLSRKIVGSYDVAVVRENQPGALNRWLAQEGFQTLPDAEDVIGFYREKRYVFACMKVSDAALKQDAAVDLHPLRFTFKTGGRDGIYFPMKMTGLQAQPFAVNLYIFYKAWINDRLSAYGYEHRGFRRKYRDWDSPRCEANAGKGYSAPDQDPFLEGFAHRLPTVTRLMQKLHPGQRYYLTNIQAAGLKPEDVRAWADDLWVFPYYVDRKFVPYDARPGGPAARAWPQTGAGEDADYGDPFNAPRYWQWAAIGIGAAVAACFAAAAVWRARTRA